ncbi:MAG: OmpH family outer membrane protein [Planctomycetes bacterium]|nr:OmpH family outer membrane protein [Planctomycetota bacterium]
MRSPLVVALVAVGSASLGLLTTRTVLSQQQPTPLQNGFVDIERVMGEYRKRQTVMQELDRRREALSQQFKTRRTQIEEKRDKLATISPESDEYLRLERELDLEMLAWKRDKEFEDGALGREQSQKFGMIYREICNEVRVQAEQKGLAAVFAYDPLPAGFETRANALAVISNRDVLWSDARLDLTNQVLQSLNAQLPPAPAAAPGGPK